MAVDSVLRIAKEQDQTPSESDYTSDSEEVCGKITKFAYFMFIFIIFLE